MDEDKLICPARTPGTLGINDQADPNRWSMPGSTPGPTGMADHAAYVCDARRAPLMSVAATTTPAPVDSSVDPDWEPLLSGSNKKRGSKKRGSGPEVSPRIAIVNQLVNV